MILQLQPRKADMPITEKKARAELYRRATESWEHLKKTHRDTWGHYDTIGTAMVEARNEIMHERDLNQPVGPGYQQDMKRWLLEHRLDDMEKGVRSRLCELIDHREDVEAMMAEWSVTQHMEWNHPNTVHRRWKTWLASKGTPSAAKVKKLNTAQHTSQELAIALERIEELNQELKSARETSPAVAAVDIGKQFPKWPLADRRQFVNDATLELLIKSATPAEQDKLRKVLKEEISQRAELESLLADAITSLDRCFKSLGSNEADIESELSADLYAWRQQHKPAG
jgi:hypothetical protein